MIMNPMYKLRHELCLTVQELAKHAKISTRTIVSIEHGYQKRINIQTLRKLQALYSIVPIEFVTEYLNWKEQQDIAAAK